MAPASVRHPRAALALWLLVVAALAVAGIGAERRLHTTNVTIDGTPSAHADDLARRYFGDSQTLVILLEGPRRDIDRQASRLVARIERRPRIAVLGPWAPGASALRPGADRTLLLVRADYDFEHVSRAVVPALRADLREAIRPPVAGHLSGYADIANGLNEASIASLRRAELIAGPLLLLVLMAVFRSPLAALLPLALGLMAIGAAAGVLDLVNRVVPIDAVGLNMASMFGLALAVDYSLLIVSRFREERARGLEVQAAALSASRTAGKTTVFAGAVLAAAMIAAALVAPGTLLLSGGIGTITAVVISVVGAATALPALLTLGGRHIDRWSIPRRGRASTRWGNAISWAIRRPVAATVLILGPLLAMSAPALAVRMGVPDPHALPKSRPERKDFDALARALPGGWMAPYEIVLANPHGPVTEQRVLARLDRWQQQLAGERRVRAVLGPAPIYASAVQARHTLTGLRAELEAGRQGASQLESGLDRLGDGATQMRAGLARAAAGAAQLAGGGAAADAGAAQLHSGLADAAAGSARLSAGLSAASSGAGSLAAGTSTAERGADRLTRLLRQAASSTGAGTGDVRRLAAQLRTGAQQLARLRQPVQSSERDLGDARAALERMLPSSKADPSYAAAYAAVLRALSTLSGRDARTGAPVAPGYDGVDAGLAAASSSGAAAAAGVARIASGSDRLARRLRLLAAGERQLAGGIARLRAGNERLRAGIALLAGNGYALTRGAAALAAGGEKLADGVAPLRVGADQLASGLRGGDADSAALGAGIERMRAGVAARSGGPQSGANARIFDSPYLVLAGLDTAPAKDRAAATFAVDLARGGSATRLVVVDAGDPTIAGDPLRRRLEREGARLSRQTGLQVAVGGPAAQLQDFAHEAGSGLWLLIVVLVAVSYLVLVPLLRSLVLPLLAVALNVLTVGAAFGVLVLLFEGDAPLGGSGRLDAIMVRAVVSIVFALSIDYAVFLLARIREGYLRTGDTERALEHGLRHTRSVITGAALIMVGVFVAFALSPVTSIRMLGIGLTIAVLLDATLVRLMLLPAAIRLLGRLSWWLPAWLDRMLPRIELEAIESPLVDAGLARDR